MKNRYHFAVISKTEFEHESGAAMSQVIGSSMRLEVSGNLDKTKYLDGKLLPRKDALKPISGCLILALVTNIRMGAQKGWWKEGEHMEWVIKNLQEAFVAVGDAKDSTLEY